MNRIKNNIELKQKLTNAIMKHGKKKTAEKILIKSLKLIQKSNKKNYKNLIKESIINSTPTFKINRQSSKRGKRKMEKEIPAFVKKDSLRTVLSFNFLLSASLKNKDLNNFYRKMSQEIIETSFQKSKSIEQKTEMQKQVLMQKRYLLKFRW
uniref:ribosomal protein S7 n=1 Tax=Nitzschia dissipata TaxID=303402 RepID=UPI002027EE4B|nr:ribosomal protein S7 [Nitzschia dissipata]QYB23050.1 ribosomal protein S7 [Nitzschia dissipata]